MNVELTQVELDRLADAVLDRLTGRLPAAPEPWPEWMSEPTAARYLDTTVGRLQKLRARDGIPYTQEATGCRVFYERAALDAWMSDKRKEL